MDMRVDYSELEKIVREKTGSELKFSSADSDTLRLTYPFRMMGRTTDVGVNLHVTGIRGNDISIEYSADGGAVVNMALNAVLNPYKEKLAGYASFSQGNNVTVHLDKIDKLQPALEKMKLSGISFGSSAAEIGLEIK